MAADTLSALGERQAVSRLIGLLPSAPFLIGGVGHDAAAIDLGLEDERVLLVNSDRTGVNLAYQFELSGPECIGDLAVSHAVSDIYASGGLPKALTIVLMLPPDTLYSFAADIERGAIEAATRYGAFVVGGDTKHNSSVVIVVTAVGFAQRSQLLLRSGAQPGDLVCVTGYLGDFLVAVTATRRRMAVAADLQATLRTALVCQRPPFHFAPRLAAALTAHSCTDISDGFPGAVHAVAAASRVGAMIDESRLPVRPEILEFGRSWGLTPLQLASAGGDWQFLYSIPPANLDKAQQIARESGHSLSAVGEFTSETAVRYRSIDGSVKSLDRLEHDSFVPGRSGKLFFDRFSDLDRG